MMERNHLMRLSRNRWLALLVIASLALIAVKPASSSASSASADKKAKKKYEGEQIFRGLLFGEEGPISKMFPEIWDRPDVKQQMNSAAKLRAWNALKEKAVKSIRKKDPDFFNRFGREIQSGEHLRIQQMLAESGRLITETIGTNGHAKADRQGEAKIVPASASGDAAAQEQAITTCGDGICVTEDSTGIYIDDDPNWTGEPQDATALACSAVAVCALAIALAVWKYAVAVDVAAVAYVAAVVVAIWKWKYKYSYSYAELAAEQTLYQEMLVNSVAEQLDAGYEYAYED